MDLIQTANATVTGDFSDPVTVWNKFIYHVSALDGLTILGTVKHDFPNGGLTGLILLGESHAAIHTWPELGKAWIELATCGDPNALTQFVDFTMT
ncbi:MAG: S-adenosylmethionine decarboxylase [Anaerolineales bacterium]|nr:S-adenosylmethionine decarboxylase [Anaerolineales bacterium]